MRYKVSYYTVPQFASKRQEMIDWCWATFGTAHITWKFKNWNWCFRYKKDYTMFLLRWA